MIRYLAALICVISFSAFTLAEQWVPMGAGKILVGAKPTHESERRGVSVWRDEATSAPHRLMVFVVNLHAVVGRLTRSSVEFQGN